MFAVGVQQPAGNVSVGRLGGTCRVAHLLPRSAPSPPGRPHPPLGGLHRLARPGVARVKQVGRHDGARPEPHVVAAQRPQDDGPRKHWLFDAEDPYAVLEAMGDTPDRPVLTIDYNDSEDPHEVVVVPVRYELDSRAEVEVLLARLRRIDDEHEEDDDGDEDGESGRHDPSIAFERYWDSLPPFPREAQGWMPAWL
jgi:hypothetical protein